MVVLIVILAACFFIKVLVKTNESASFIKVVATMAQAILEDVRPAVEDIYTT